MNDAEAEAVVLALANPLVWAVNEETPSVFHESGRYSVNGAAWEWKAMKIPDIAEIVAAKPFFLISTIRKSVDHATQIYSSIEEAKAACERHHATGKWE